MEEGEGKEPRATEEGRKEERRDRPGPMETLQEKLRGAKPILTVLLAAAVLLLVFQNQEPVHTRFLLWRVEMPRFFLLAVVYLLGIVTGWIVFWRSRRPPR